MIKFRKPAIVAAMLCFSAMMAAGCTYTAITVVT